MLTLLQETHSQRQGRWYQGGWPETSSPTSIAALRFDFRETSSAEPSEDSFHGVEILAGVEDLERFRQEDPALTGQISWALLQVMPAFAPRWCGGLTQLWTGAYSYWLEPGATLPEFPSQLRSDFDTTNCVLFGNVLETIAFLILCESIYARRRATITSTSTVPEGLSSSAQPLLLQARFELEVPSPGQKRYALRFDYYAWHMGARDKTPAERLALCSAS